VGKKSRRGQGKGGSERSIKTPLLKKNFLLPLHPGEEPESLLVPPPQGLFSGDDSGYEAGRGLIMVAIEKLDRPVKISQAPKDAGIGAKEAEEINVFSVSDVEMYPPPPPLEAL